MKIVVYNYKNQYALSRMQIEAIKSVLPKEYFLPIREFHLTHTKKGAEVFEYCEEDKTAHFAFPITRIKTEHSSEAIVELLVGLARIKASTRWKNALNERERETYMEFVELWKSRCIDAANTK